MKKYIHFFLVIFILYKSYLKDEDNSKITILKVEKYNYNEIVIHIYVNGLKIKNKLIANGISEEIGNLPISK